MVILGSRCRRISQKNRQIGGRNLIVWGMVLSNDLIHLKRLKGRINNVISCNMLGYGVLLFLDNIYWKKNYFFQQNNASIHVCKDDIVWFREQEIKLLDLPSRSADLNLTENIWKMLSDIVYDEKQVINKDLWIVIQEACQSLMNSTRLVVREMFNKYNLSLLYVIDLKWKTITY